MQAKVVKRHEDDQAMRAQLGLCPVYDSIQVAPRKRSSQEAKNTSRRQYLSLKSGFITHVTHHINNLEELEIRKILADSCTIGRQASLYIIHNSNRHNRC